MKKSEFKTSLGRKLEFSLTGDEVNEAILEYIQAKGQMPDDIIEINKARSSVYIHGNVLNNNSEIKVQIY